MTGLVTALALLSSTILALVSAAPPVFPDNLVVFPNRDFVTIEGFIHKQGETGTIEVTRNGVIMGSAQGVVSGGDVAFEINHPGGYCWGAGTNLLVTPDILPGDVVTIKFNGVAAGDVTVQDAYVTHSSYDGNLQLEVMGRFGPNVNSDNVEQRIVNPEFRALAGRRDIRAVPGPMTPAPKGGYSSQLVITGTTFTATYVFDTLELAQLAANGGGYRLLTWEVTDVDANRQGITIAELGEAGGPGMGGCPLGPADAVPPAGSYSAVFTAADSSYKITWTPTFAQPGAEAVTHYDVQLFENIPTYPRKSFGIRKAAGGQTFHTFTGLTGTADSYLIEVRSLAGNRLSAPFTPPPPPKGTTLPGTLTADPPANADPNVAVAATQVSLTSTGGEIYYTLDGTSPISAGLPSDTALLYVAPIPITAPTVIHAVAINADGNFVLLDPVGFYEPPPPNVPPPVPADAVPTGLTAIAGVGSATLKWFADERVTGFGIRQYIMNAAGDMIPIGTVVDTVGRETTDRLVTISGLRFNVQVWFTVAIKRADGTYGPETSCVPVTPKSDAATITSAQLDRTDLRVAGTGSVDGAAITLYAAGATGLIDRNRPLGATLVVRGAWSIRNRNADPLTSIFAESTGGALAGPFTVTVRR
ncbi:hypothetical protein HK104_005611 [Borealophlyctis nickersoniae]|nr:hypothetical protein HK104_005611 [Borealophlyctis nickersoniae]